MAGFPAMLRRSSNCISPSRAGELPGELPATSAIRSSVRPPRGPAERRGAPPALVSTLEPTVPATLGLAAHASPGSADADPLRVLIIISAFFLMTRRRGRACVPLAQDELAERP